MWVIPYDLTIAVVIIFGLVCYVPHIGPIVIGPIVIGPVVVKPIIIGPIDIRPNVIIY